VGRARQTQQDAFPGQELLPRALVRHHRKEGATTPPRVVLRPKEENLGEIDLDIQDHNNDSFITCEAFIFRDFKRVQSHIEKVIAYYSNKRTAFIVLVYFKGKQRNFDGKWKKYSDGLVPGLKYPTGFEITSKAVDDLSNKYGFKESAIKIGKSEHGAGRYLYHIFVNLNYKIDE
jgi:hypothetical protein